MGERGQADDEDPAGGANRHRVPGREEPLMEHGEHDGDVAIQDSDELGQQIEVETDVNQRQNY